jgi:hypothetical protein
MAASALSSVDWLDKRVLEVDERVAADFECSNCGEAYDDSPPLIVVRKSDGSELPFCVDRCAESMGFVDAVLARRRAEARGDAICIIYLAL